jgi:hypothetical protein
MLFGGNLIKAADRFLEAYSGRKTAPGSGALRAWTRHRKPFDLAIPVRNCANTQTSLRFSLSYRRRVCLPGSAHL